MRCCGKREGLNRLLQLELLLLLLQLRRFWVAVREMAEFVCHTPDHNQGIRVGCVGGRGRKDGGKKKKEWSKSIKCVATFALALFLLAPNLDAISLSSIMTPFLGSQMI